MELVALHKRVIGLDVHQAQITACAIIEESDGTTCIEQRQFGAFKRDRRALAEWAASLLPDEVVMESTGIYWKSPYAALEAVGIRGQVVNARHVKNVPGRKTDVGDAQWLATLARAGLLRGSFVPPAKLRELRLISRQRQKLAGQLSSEKNRTFDNPAHCATRSSRPAPLPQNTKTTLLPSPASGRGAGGEGNPRHKLATCAKISSPCFPPIFPEYNATTASAAMPNSAR